LFTQFDYGDPDNGQSRAQNQVYPLAEIGYIRRMSDTWTIGAGIYTPTGFGSIYGLNGPAPFSGVQKYESFGSLTKMLVGASYTPADCDCISIGATIGPGLSFVNLEGPYTLQGPTAPGLPTLLDMGVSGVGFTWSIGASCQLTQRTSVGLSYLGEVNITADGTVGLISPLGMTTYDAEASIAWPRSLGAGIRHQWSDRIVVATDVIWYNWSNAFDSIDLALRDPTNGAYPPMASESFPLQWRDTVSTRVGLEYQFCNGHVGRMGYVHHRSPIPANTITPWIPGALENAFSLGYGFDWRGWNTNVSYMFSYGPTVEVGTSAFIGGDFDQSVHRNKSHAVSFSLSRMLGPGCR
jgi:long-subunit fatty acid transport protein